MKAVTLTTVARLLLGAIFVFAGLNGLALAVGLEPAGPTALDVPLMQVLVKTSFVFIPLKLLETMAGLLLLTNRFVPLALLALAPISINILLFHLFANQALLLNGVVVVLLLGILLYRYRQHYTSLLQPKADQR